MLYLVCYIEHYATISVINMCVSALGLKNIGNSTLNISITKSDGSRQAYNPDLVIGMLAQAAQNIPNAEEKIGELYAKIESFLFNGITTVQIREVIKKTTYQYSFVDSDYEVIAQKIRV